MASGHGWLGRSMCSAAESRMARNRSTTKAMLIASQTKTVETANSTIAKPRYGTGTNIRRLTWFLWARSAPELRSRAGAANLAVSSS